MYKENLCCHCGKCFEKCSHTDCKPYNRCLHVCPNRALELAGYEISADELAEKIKANDDMFKSLNGGVTFSGGEPMMQADFVCEVSDKLIGIHKAIQTSGYTDIETYKRVIDKMDYVMQDIKLVNDEKHIEYTGVSNKKILENIEWLKHSGKEFVFRVPMIPNITDTEENIRAIKEIAEDFPTEFLPYNEMAGAKYEMLGMEYKL